MEEGSYNVSNHFTISLILLVLLLVSLIRNSAVLCGKKSLCVAVSFKQYTSNTVVDSSQSWFSSFSRRSGELIILFLRRSSWPVVCNG